MTTLLIALVVLAAVAVVVALIVVNIEDYRADLRFWRRDGTTPPRE